VDMVLLRNIRLSVGTATYVQLPFYILAYTLNLEDKG